MRKTKEDCRQSGCPVAFCLDIFGDRWSLLVIRDIAFLGKKYFGDFLESPEGIASNILTDRLKRLEESGILTKNSDPENQKKFIYKLTPKGIDLIPIILEAVLWGGKHDDGSLVQNEFYQRIKKNRDKTFKEIAESIRAGKSYFVDVLGFDPTSTT